MLMTMSFRLIWTNAGAILTLGTLASVACRTPGEGWQESTALDSGGASNAAAASTNAGNTMSAATSVGGAQATGSSDATSSVDGSSSTADSSATTTTDDSTSDDGSTATTSSTTSSGGASSTETSSTDGSSGDNGSNLIDNGDFSTSDDACMVDESDWSTEGNINNFTGVDEVTCGYCIVMEADDSGQLNWSGNSGVPPTLDAATTYRFAFDVWSPEGETTPTLSAKVGQPVEPYDGFLEEDVSVTNSQTTASFTFTMDTSDAVGIAFFVGSPGAWSKICFDNIVIEAE